MLKKIIFEEKKKANFFFPFFYKDENANFGKKTEKKWKKDKI